VGGHGATVARLIPDQVAVQEARASGAELMLDLQTAHEHVDRFNLIAAAKASGYPMGCLMAGLRVHTWPRRLVFNRMVSRSVVPRRGIAAGSPFATFELWALVGPVVVALAKQHSQTIFSLHVDDLSITVQEETDIAATETLHQVTADPAYQFEDQLGLQFAPDKAALAGNTPKVVQLASYRWSSQFPNLGGGEVARRLGVDYGIFKPRKRRSPYRVRQNRLSALCVRAKRLRAIFAAKRAPRLFATEVLPAGTFGSLFGPWSPKELAVLVSRALVALRLRPPGVAAALARAAKPVDLDPQWKSMSAPNLGWAKEVWISQAHGYRRPLHALNGRELHLARELVQRNRNLSGVLGALAQAVELFGLSWPVAHVFRDSSRDWGLTAGPQHCCTKCLRLFASSAG
jgi:hypothetical protein